MKSHTDDLKVMVHRQPFLCGRQGIFSYTL